ncbi:MAG TPA: M56 family metallopeptidase [Bryobacteraceae bacterium]|jgi:uncharacterized protein (TIGR03435 family)
MIPEALSPLANHLWQSTLFAGVAGLLVLALRNNPARVRHAVWVAASLKFLIPFSLLIAIGGRIEWRTASASPAPLLSTALDQAAQPFAPAPETSFLTGLPPVPPASPLLPIVSVLWACGVLGIAGSWWIRRRTIAAALRAGSRVDLGLPIEALCSPAFIEPGVFGVFRPVLLLPEGIFRHLTQEQWKAVVAHELCHVRRRDNLVGLLQMLVETVFWFHPLTWWLGKRIFQERELACDEEVLSLGNPPRAYAQGILKICELYLESPLPCVAGVSGSNLRKRIEAILNGRIAKSLNAGKKGLLAAAGLFAVAAPVVIGLLHGVTLRAQTVPPALRFEVASVKPAVPTPGVRRPRTTGIPGPNNTDPGRFRAQEDLLNLILIAYEIPLYRLADPDGRFSPLMEIETKMPVDTTREQFNVMLQNLLADRLGLKVHWTTKDVEMYNLLVAKGGPKIKPAAPDSPQTGDDASQPANAVPPKIGADGFPIPPPGNRSWMGVAPGKMVIRGHNETLTEMARTIGPRTLDGPMMDATGLTGKYDYTISWSTTAQSAALRLGNPAADPDGPSAFEALEQQLGLKIEKRKGPVQMLVVDHIEKKPTEN